MRRSTPFWKALLAPLSWVALSTWLLFGAIGVSTDSRTVAFVAIAHLLPWLGSATAVWLIFRLRSKPTFILLLTLVAAPIYLVLIGFSFGALLALYQDLRG